MSQPQELGEGTAAHNTPSIVPPNVESELPNFPWTLPPGLLEAELEKRKTQYVTGDDPQKAEREREKAWSKTTNIVQQYSDEMIKRWNLEIDTYLVFAGLFSAVLTAFNVESYLLLQPATPDPTLLALQQISLQLSSFSTGPPPMFVNSTHPAFQQGDTTPPPVPRAAVWLNTLWFSSLILSLSSASIGIMVKQWLNEYISGISSDVEPGGSRHTARLRQYRLNNLVMWHVGDIVNTIPVLLQVSVALFLAGLLVLLWTLHPTVAVVVSVLTGLLGAFTLSTVLLPSIKPGCAYISPQSLALYHVLRRGPSLIKVSLKQISGPLTFYLLEHSQIMCLSTRKLANALWEWEPIKAPTWHGFEQALISEESQSLDVDIISAAYDTAMKPDLLVTAALCLSELEPSIHVVDCVERLQHTDEIHFGVSPSPYVCAVASATGPVIYDLWVDALLCYSFHLELQQVMPQASNTPTYKPILRSYERLFSHFDSPTWQPPSNPRSVERVLRALSIAACQNWNMPFRQSVIWDSIRVILVRCNRSKSFLRNVRYAAAAAQQVLSQNLPPHIEYLPHFCEYSRATDIMLECMLAASRDLNHGDHLAILPYADLALLRLTDSLQHADEEDLARNDQYWLFESILLLSNLVNILTEEPTLPALSTLRSQDRIFALEHAVVAAQGAIRLCGQSEKDYRIRNRAGDSETLNDKLARLRAIRSCSGPAAHEAPPSATYLLTSLSASVLDESSVTESQSTSYHSVLGEPHPTSERAPSDRSVRDEPRASPRSSPLYYSASDMSLQPT